MGVATPSQKSFDQTFSKVCGVKYAIVVSPLFLCEKKAQRKEALAQLAALKRNAARGFRSQHESSALDSQAFGKA